MRGGDKSGQRKGREGRSIGRGVLVFLEYLVEFSLAQKQLKAILLSLVANLCSYLKSPYFHTIPSQIQKNKTEQQPRMTF